MLNVAIGLEVSGFDRTVNVNVLLYVPAWEKLCETRIKRVAEPLLPGARRCVLAPPVVQKLASPAPCATTHRLVDAELSRHGS